MSTENIKPAAGPNALQDFTTCPDWGKGGQYVYDPVTGTRTRVDDAPAAAEATDASNPAAAAAADTTALDDAGTPAATSGATVTKKDRSRG